MNRIKELRESLGIKQIELAKELRVSQGTLSNWERGIHDPDNDILLTLAIKFDVTTDYLLGRSDNPAPIDTKKALGENAERIKEISPEAYEVLDSFTHMDEAQRKMVLAMVRAAVEEEHGPQDK